MPGFFHILISIAAQETLFDDAGEEREGTGEDEVTQEESPKR